MITIARRIALAAAGVALAAAGTAAAAGPASAAAVRHPHRTVFVTDEHSKITSPCDLSVGESLTGIGPAAGRTFTVISLKADGPVDVVVLSAPLPGSGVFDFLAPA